MCSGMWPDIPIADRRLGPALSTAARMRGMAFLLGEAVAGALEVGC